MVLPEAEPGLRPGLPSSSWARASSPSGGGHRRPTPAEPDYDSFAWQVLDHAGDRGVGAESADGRFAVTSDHATPGPRSPASDMTARHPRTTGRRSRHADAGIEADPAAQRGAVRRAPRRGRRRGDRDAARDELVHLHLPLVEHCARRFRNRGEPLRGPGPGRHDRPDQVDRPVRLRPRRGVLDVRHPDDHRRDQALLPRQGLGDPGAAPAAGAADADRRRHRRAHPVASAAPPRRASWPRRSAARSRRSSRASSPATPTRRCRSTPATTATTARPTMLDALGVDDEGLEHVEIRESIKPLLDRLDPREKKILLLRFFKNMTQSQIAEEIGVSQMHVSRLLTRTLEQLRDLAGGARLTAVSRGASSSALSAGRVEAAPTSTTSATDGEHRPPPTVVSPPRKLQATPSWISWASTTGLRAQDGAPVQRPGAEQQPGAVRHEEDARWSAPIVSRSELRLASSSTAEQHEHQRPRRPTSEAATTSGGRIVGRADGHDGRSTRASRMRHRPAVRL